MKYLIKILIILFLTMPTIGMVNALETVNSQLNRIENSLWGFDYKKESNTERLNRIEQEIYGQVEAEGAETEQARIDRIYQTLGLEATREEETKIQKQADDIQSAGVSYPRVNAMEESIFGRTYEKESIYKRLDRLEQKLFMAVQTGDLNQRFERLENKIQVRTTYSQYQTPQVQKQYEYQSNPYSANDAYSMEDVYLQLSGLENTIFRKTYNQDPLGVRLNRLERKIFQRDFTSDDDWTRLQRIQAASNAQKTAKYYDSNKVQKLTTTGIQLGTLILMILACIL